VPNGGYFDQVRPLMTGADDGCRRSAACCVNVGRRMKGEGIWCRRRSDDLLVITGMAPGTTLCSNDRRHFRDPALAAAVRPAVDSSRSSETE